MKQTIDAVFENGLLRPLEPLNLLDHQRVSVTVDTKSVDDLFDRDAMELARREGDPSISLTEVRQRLAKTNGSLSELVIAERDEF